MTLRKILFSGVGAIALAFAMPALGTAQQAATVAVGNADIGADLVVQAFEDALRGDVALNGLLLAIGIVGIVGVVGVVVLVLAPLDRLFPVELLQEQFFLLVCLI